MRRVDVGRVLPSRRRSECCPRPQLAAVRLTSLSVSAWQQQRDFEAISVALCAQRGLDDAAERAAAKQRGVGVLLSARAARGAARRVLRLCLISRSRRPAVAAPLS
jgi:hypothetical protein